MALEGALKLKELAYLRAEGYPAGELKHGPIALIEPGTVVVGIATRNRLWEKMLSNIAEVHSRGATVVLVADDGDEERPPWPTTCCGCRRPTPCSRPSSAWSPCSSWPTAWPACTATTSTAPATWPRR